jgi:hypothetical protein
MAGAVAPTEASIAAAAQAAKNQIKASDEKSTEYKAALRNLQNSADNENDTPNTVTLTWTQVSLCMFDDDAPHDDAPDIRCLVQSARRQYMTWSLHESNLL